MQNQNLENGSQVDEKMYPYSNPSRSTDRKNIAMSLYTLVVFVVATVAIGLYSIETRNKILNQQLYVVLIGAEFLPRNIYTFIIYKYTSFSFWDLIGVFKCGPYYYYWRGKGRKSLTRNLVNRLEYIVDALGIIRLVLICFVVWRNIEMTNIDEVHGMDRSLLITLAGLLLALILTASLHVFIIIVFLVKKLGRYLFGDRISCCCCTRSDDIPENA
ncbi:2161_t:CDS:2 [Ambispora gerdemannii]|uniref:2161_t:CDS:1 n=1 Tax=Ambispora gerdemannii TaxID=144530 RepID=A0A9N9GMR5_9GLOM|nr:2161_t:CDS:2 [Ambispora gerdemannii]